MEPFEILTSRVAGADARDRAPVEARRGRARSARGGGSPRRWSPTLEAGGVLDVRDGRRGRRRVPARSLADEGPEYDRPASAGAGRSATTRPSRPFDGDLGDALLACSPRRTSHASAGSSSSTTRSSRATRSRAPGSDAAVVRVPGTMKGARALAPTGRAGSARSTRTSVAMHAVAEAARNVAVTGARPLAITNCLNFGNPERPEVMWQFAEAIRGMRDACRALGTPVTGGNVSFYNECGDSAIGPTPVIGMLGSLEDHRLRVPRAFPRPALAIYLLGETFPELGGSEFAEAVLGTVAGAPPALDLAAGRRLRAAPRGRGRPTCSARPRLRRRRPGGRARRIRDRGRARLRGHAHRRPAGARRAVQRVGLARRRVRRARARGLARASRRRGACRARGSARRAAPGRWSTACSTRPCRSSPTSGRARSRASSASPSEVFSRRRVLDDRMEG